jgi:microcystin-dependent protein
MAYEINSPNMRLPVPGVGLTSGPQYAIDLNACLAIIDQHNHTPGSGIQITPAGLNINSDLTFNSVNNAVQLRSTRYIPQPSVLTPAADIACVYVAGADLYYNDTNGSKIALTSNGSIAGTAGSISGLPSGTASASFSAGTFTFQSATSTAANLDGRNVILRNSTALSSSLTLQPPNPIPASYSLTLPNLPASAAFMSVDPSGIISAAPSLTGGVTLAMLAAAVAQSLNPAGTILSYAGAGAPTGYLLCTGAAVSRTTYSGLFSAIGTTWGVGDGTTTFNLPNGQGMFLRGSGTQTVAGIAYDGGTLGTTQGDTFQGHFHGTVGTNGASLSVGGQSIPRTGLGEGANTSAVTGPTSDGINGLVRTSTETRPVNLSINYIIKT